MGDYKEAQSILRKIEEKRESERPIREAFARKAITEILGTKSPKHALALYRECQKVHPDISTGDLFASLLDLLGDGTVQLDDKLRPYLSRR